MAQVKTDRNNAIVSAFVAGRTGKSLAKEYGITKGRVSRLVSQCGETLSVTDVQKRRALAVGNIHRKTIAERFWEKVAKGGASECWLWLASMDGHGYGQLRVDRKNKTATHISLELAGRPRPSQDHVAMHECDVPACVNPNHLNWGTRKDNHQDALQKGRLNLMGLDLGRAQRNKEVVR